MKKKIQVPDIVHLAVEAYNQRHFEKAIGDWALKQGLVGPFSYSYDQFGGVYVTGEVGGLYDHSDMD